MRKNRLKKFFLTDNHYWMYANSKFLSAEGIGTSRAGHSLTIEYSTWWTMDTHNALQCSRPSTTEVVPMASG
jgi:hypothetical protein